jgi:hypothetical protein
MVWQNQYHENGCITKSNVLYNGIPFKIPKTFNIQIEKSTLKFICKHKKTKIAKARLSKKNAEDITIPDFKLYYRVITIKAVWYWHKNRDEDQWKRIKDPDLNPHSYAHLIFEKGVQNIRGRKDNDFNKCCWENRIPACRKLNLHPCLSLCRNINSKSILY